MLINFDGETYDFDFERDLDLNKARYLKRQIGMTINKFREGLFDGDPDCLAGLYWLMLNANGKAVDISRVNFNVAELAEAFSKAAEEDEENPTQSPASDETTPNPK